MTHENEHIVKVDKKYYLVKSCAETIYNPVTHSYEGKISLVDFYPLKKLQYIKYIDKIFKNYIYKIKYKIKRI